MRLLVLIIFVVLATEARTQEPRQKNARNYLSVAPGFTQLKELNLETVIHRGPAISVNYRRLLGGSGSFLVVASYAGLATAFEDPVSSHLAHFHLSYGKQVWKLSKGAFSYAASATVAADYRLAYLPNWDESHLYWANTWSVGGSFSAEYLLPSSQSLEWKICLPVVALVSRPQTYRDYKIDDLSLGGVLESFHSRTSVGSWGRYFEVQSRLLYLWNTSALFYELNYCRITSAVSEPVLILSHQIGWQWRF